ncbi:MAG: RHS domain-containing protein [Deltaproteobacteria bacterium]|nr:RHS domain-containing protein [Deltaproteobacteria bacterium]
MGEKTSYVYDVNGRLTDIMYFNPGDPVNPVKTFNFGPFSKTFHYEHYHNGLKKRFVMPDNTGYDYTYDDANQLVGVQISDVGAITVNSYNWNRPDSISLPGGSKQEYIYDPLMRIKSITDKDPAQNVLMQYNYNYDKMDNITAKATWQGIQNYTYDDLYRLSASDHPMDADESFTYDSVGNRLTSADSAGTWSYNLNNELQGFDTVSYDYDANGNMIQKTVGGVETKFFYNTEDRLSEVRDGSDNLIASYYYDPFGRRLWKEVSGVRTYFYYADEGLVAELDASGNVTKSYGYKPGSIWTTDPLFMKIGTDYYFYQNDPLGTPQKLTAINGAGVWAAKYSSFGEAGIDAASTITNNLRFPGQYYDQETSLHYNYHRYYDPGAGRYITPDPIGLNGGINVLGMPQIVL